MSIGKVLGFLGLTSDVTGFELEPAVLAIGLAIGVIIQLLKDDSELTVTVEDGSVRPYGSNSKSDKKSR